MRGRWRYRSCRGVLPHTRVEDGVRVVGRSACVLPRMCSTGSAGSGITTYIDDTRPTSPSRAWWSMWRGGLRPNDAYTGGTIPLAQTACCKEVMAYKVSQSNLLGHYVPRHLGQTSSVGFDTMGLEVYAHAQSLDIPPAPSRWANRCPVPG